MNNPNRTIQNRLFDIAWILFLGSQLVSLTAWYALNTSPVKVVVYKTVALISCGFCLAVIVINLIRKIYPVKTISCYVVVGVVFAISWYFSKDFMLIWTFLLFGSVYEISGKRVLTIALVLTATSLMLTALSAIVNPELDYIFVETTRTRYGLGYVFTTVGTSLTFFAILVYIYLRKNNLHFWELIALELVNVLFYVLTVTKLPFFFMTFILIILAVCRYIKVKKQFAKGFDIFFCIVPLIICAFALILFAEFTFNVPSWERLDDFLHDRLALGKNALGQYGVNLFGHEIVWNGASIVPVEGLYDYVDCSYIKNLLEYGAVAMAAIVGIYTRLMYRAVKIKDYFLVFIAGVILVHSFTEPRIMDLSFNVIPLLTFAKLGEEPVVYKKGFLREIFAGSAQNPAKSTVKQM